MPQSLYPDLGPRARAQLAAVVAIAHNVLGGNAVGAYLYGSAVLGGLRPASDLDVFTVIRRPTTEADKRALVDRLLPISGPRAVSGPARSIEVTIVVQSDIRPWAYPPTLDFLYGDWLRVEFERGELTTSRPNPDLAVLITIILTSGWPLFGPPPAEVFDPVPHADLERALVDVIPGLLDDLESDTSNVILTLARIWTTLVTGEIRPKDAAAAWVLTRVPEEHRAVLARARAIYLGEEPDQWEDLSSRVRAHADYVVRTVQARALRIRRR